MITASKNTPEWNYRFSRSIELPGFWPFVFVCWIITLNAFSYPGREAPLTLTTLDWIAVVKVITRLLAAILLTVTLYRLPITFHKRQVMRQLFPFAMLGLWAIISTAWSTQKAMSFGHAVEIPMFVLLGAVAGILCVDNRSISRLLFHVSICALVASLLSLILYFYFPYSEGPRGIVRSSGVNHPNFTAQVAGAGLLLLVVCRLLWNWTWTRVLLFPALVIEGLILFIAQTRTSIFATLVVLVIFILVVRPSSFFFMMLLFLTAASITFLITQFDASLDLSEPIVDYFMRRQTKEEFMTATGRVEIWTTGLEFFLHSPLLGHGYYVFPPILGKTGAAHNVLLHVLAGIGVVGGILLFWGLYRPLMAARGVLRCNSNKRKVAILVFTVISWFLLVGLFDVSFLAQVGFPPLLFYIILGIAAGCVSKQWQA